MNKYQQISLTIHKSITCGIGVSLMSSCSSKLERQMDLIKLTLILPKHNPNKISFCRAVSSADESPISNRPEILVRTHCPWFVTYTDRVVLYWINVTKFIANETWTNLSWCSRLAGFPDGISITEIYTYIRECDPTYCHRDGEWLPSPTVISFHVRC